ncbi:Conserved_hypothetical protein [Hexamita inflata]|uniref:Cyclin N-terminal domain-containing protein n=1 Tax=Hexamita inflata TaxID=28002 RepID=A0ABP1KIF6_9EUKA
MTQQMLTQSQYIDFCIEFLSELQKYSKNYKNFTLEQQILYGSDSVNLYILLTRLMNSGTEKVVIEIALVLFFRILSVYGIDNLTQFNCHRLIFTSLILANIGYKDDIISLSRWHQMINYTWEKSEIEYMKLEMLAAINFKLHVSIEEIQLLQTNILLPFQNHKLSYQGIQQYLFFQLQINNK